MNRMKLCAAALAAILIGGSSADAACKMAQVGNRTWTMSATDSTANKNLIYCKFTTSAAGTVPLTPNGCTVYSGAATNFLTPFPIDLISVAITQETAGGCVFNLDMGLVAPAAQNLKARLVMGSGKSAATGSWVSNFGSFGTASITRQ